MQKPRIDLAHIPGISIHEMLGEIHITAAVMGNQTYKINELRQHNIQAGLLTMLDEMKTTIDGIAEKVKGR